MTIAQTANGAVHGEIVEAAPDALVAQLAARSDDGPIVRTDSAEVDTQVATAKRYPRSVTGFLAAARGMIEVSEDVAAACSYTLPRDGKRISGPSIRLAEIVAAAWGNLRIAGRVVAIEERHIVAEGLCWDLERNICVRQEVMRRITGKTGRRYGDDMIVVTGQAAISIAIRNAIVRVVPGVYTGVLLEHSRRIVAGDVKTLDVRRAKALQYGQAMGLTDEQMFAAVGAAGIADLTGERLADLRGLFTAIKDGDARIDEVFPPAQKAGGLNEALAAAPKPAQPAIPMARKEPAERPADAIPSDRDGGDEPVDPADRPPPGVDDERGPDLAPDRGPDLSVFDPARDACRLWCEAHDRPTPSPGAVEVALVSLARDAKYGDLAHIAQTPDVLKVFLSRARSTRTDWGKHLPKQ